MQLPGESNYEGAAGDVTAADGMPPRAGIKRQGVLACTCARHVWAGTTGLYGSWWAHVEDKQRQTSNMAIMAPFNFGMDLRCCWAPLKINAQSQAIKN